MDFNAVNCSAGVTSAPVFLSKLQSSIAKVLLCYSFVLAKIVMTC